MPDYKAMYYHLAGRMATAVEVLEGAIEAASATNLALTKSTAVLVSLAESLKMAQRNTEEMFMNSDGDPDDSEL